MLSRNNPRRVLLVEGQDDEHVVRHLRERNLPMPEFGIDDKGGKDPLLAAIEADVLAPGRTAVGILVDADGDLQARWQAVADRLLRANITSPDKPDPSGTIIDSTPRIGIWLMPNNETSGELEDFVADMVPKGDPVWPKSQAYIDGIPTSDRKFSQGKTLRAQVHAWLATRERPRPMGAAIGARDLNVDTPGVTRLVDWLRRLFG